MLILGAHQRIRQAARRRRGEVTPATPGSKPFSTDLYRRTGRRNRKSLLFSLVYLNMAFSLSILIAATPVTLDDIRSLHDLLVSGMEVWPAITSVPALLAFARLSVILGATYLFGVLCLFGQRFRDAGLSGLWALLIPVPYAGTAALAAAFMLPSWPGANSYGPDPRFGNRTGAWD